MKARDREIPRQRMEIVPQKEGRPGESCDQNLAELAPARTLVPARLPLLRIDSFQTWRSPYTGPVLLYLRSSTGSLYVLLETLLLVCNWKHRMSFMNREPTLFLQAIAARVVNSVALAQSCRNPGPERRESVWVVPF